MPARLSVVPCAAEDACNFVDPAQAGRLLLCMHDIHMRVPDEANFMHRADADELSELTVVDANDAQGDMQALASWQLKNERQLSYFRRHMVHKAMAGHAN